MDDQNLQFPLHVQTGEGDFVIERDDDLSPTSPDYYGSPDSLERGVRLKRRRRCGQCGPCQVKENCNKCHFCLRREVLKQTCIYRKCVYLRAKPKPYARPKDSPHHNSSSAANTSNDSVQGLSQDSNRSVTSPQLSYTTPPETQPSSQLNRSDCVSSPPNRNDVAKPILPPQPKLSDHFPFNSLRPSFPFESAIRPPQHPSLPHPQPSGHVQSPPRLPSMPASMPSVINQHHSIIPPVPPVHGLMDQSASLSHNHHQMVLHPHSQNSLGERAYNDFTSQLQPVIGMPHGLNSQSATGPHHPLNKLSLRNSHTQEMTEPQLHYPGFGKSSIDSSRPSVSSSCVYPHSIPPSMSSTTMERPGVFSGLDRASAGPTYFPTNADMFRHFSSLPPSYPYPPGVPRFGQNFTPSPYGRYRTMGMPPPPNLPLPRPQSSHHSHPPHHQPWGFPQTYNCDQSDTCPKNGCCPPASQSLGLDAPVMQERYGSILNFKHLPKFGLPPPLDVAGHQRWLRRPESALSDDSGRFSMASSDFECDVISIDDCQMNALIRSDGCNSLQIEIESRTADCSGKKGLRKTSLDVSHQVSSSLKETSSKGCEKKEKYVVPGTVYLKQDLGDEGIIQLEIPGHKVTLEDSFLDDKLAEYSSNISELLDFIKKEPQIEYLRVN